MMVIATTVEAEPIGVMLPPKLAPKITLHQYGDAGLLPLSPITVGSTARIFASTAANGMLSVTELAAAALASNEPWATDAGSVSITPIPRPIRASTSACSIT